MEFSYCAAGLFIGIWLVQIVLSVLEGTFYSKGHCTDFNLDLPLSRHWGIMIGDPILAIMNGFIWPHLNFDWHSFPLLIISGLISWQLHKSWWGIRGHIFPDNYKSIHQATIVRYHGPSAEILKIAQEKYWYFDLSEAGWVHLIFFVLQLELIFEFIVTPMPPTVVKTTASFLLLFAPFGVFQPGYAEWTKKVLREPKSTWFWKSFISILAMWAAIFAVGYFKT